MSFPETRHTLIRRIATGTDDAAWREFLGDYWSPVCRFAQRRGNLNLQDAEDVASQVFEAFLRNELLSRWANSPAAKLRTLICTVVRNVLSNRARVQSGRERLNAERLLEQPNLGQEPQTADVLEQQDIFYADWVDNRLQAAVESLLAEYQQSGKGDYFRVLYGRICEEMSIAEVSELLRIKPTSTENYFRHAKQRLGERLQEMVRDHVRRYSETAFEEPEFEAEWQKLGEYLKQHGGLEGAVRRAYADFDPAYHQACQARIADATIQRGVPSR